MNDMMKPGVPSAVSSIAVKLNDALDSLAHANARIEELEAELASLKDEVAAKQRGYDDLHEMMDKAGVSRADIWTRLERLLNETRVKR